MSTIGTNFFAANIASSAAGAQRVGSDEDQVKANGESQRTRKEQSRSFSVEELHEADLDADRDPDGRQPWQTPEDPRDESTDPEQDAPEATAGDESEPEAPPRRQPDSVDFRGLQIDLEA